MYVVTCIGLRDHLLTNPQYGRGEVLMVQLQTNVRDPETGEWVVLERMCNKVWSPKSSLWACAEALGYPVKPGEALDTDRLIGLRCQALVKDEVGNDGAVYSKVDALVPLPHGDQQPTGQTIPPWDAPPPAQDNPLAQQLYQRADELARQGHARDDQQFPPLKVLTQNGTIDWAEFWLEAGKRSIGRPVLCNRLNVYENELDEHLRGMMPLSVIQLLNQ